MAGSRLAVAFALTYVALVATQVVALCLLIQDGELVGSLVLAGALGLEVGVALVAWISRSWGPKS